MRLCAAAILLTVVQAMPSVAEEVTFPYRAYVTSNDVYVRSGPGKNYYPTNKLAVGTAVEVYRHDPGGWYAVRPPEGSFAWVSGRYLQPTGDEGLQGGRRRGGGPGGSEFSDIRDVIQVHCTVERSSRFWRKRSLARGQKPRMVQDCSAVREFRWVFGSLSIPTIPEVVYASHRRRTIRCSTQHRLITHLSASLLGLTGRESNQLPKLLPRRLRHGHR